jgi:hypothetical protein
LLEQVVLSIVEDHEIACLAASSLHYGVCGLAKEDILQTPLHINHGSGVPVLTVWVQSICGKEECEVGAKQKIEGVMDGLRQDISRKWDRDQKAPWKRRLAKFVGRRWERRDVHGARS